MERTLTLEKTLILVCIGQFAFYTETQDSSLRKLFGLEDATLPARKNTTVCHIFVVRKRSRIQHKILSRHRRYFRSWAYMPVHLFLFLPTPERLQHLWRCGTFNCRACILQINHHLTTCWVMMILELDQHHQELLTWRIQPCFQAICVEYT